MHRFGKKIFKKVKFKLRMHLPCMKKRQLIKFTTQNREVFKLLCKMIVQVHLNINFAIKNICEYSTFFRHVSSCIAIACLARIYVSQRYYLLSITFFKSVAPTSEDPLVVT